MLSLLFRQIPGHVENASLAALILVVVDDKVLSVVVPADVAAAHRVAAAINAVVADGSNVRVAVDHTDDARHPPKIHLHQM